MKNEMTVNDYLTTEELENYKAYARHRRNGTLAEATDAEKAAWALRHRVASNLKAGRPPRELVVREPSAIVEALPAAMQALMPEVYRLQRTKGWHRATKAHRAAWAAYVRAHRQRKGAKR